MSDIDGHRRTCVENVRVGVLDGGEFEPVLFCEVVPESSLFVIQIFVILQDQRIAERGGRFQGSLHARLFVDGQNDLCIVRLKACEFSALIRF